MSQTTVVNLRKESYDVYIGRRRKEKFHYGNPFTHHIHSCAKVLVHSREESILAFSHWLKGDYMPEIEPDRRVWILANLKELKGKRLGCFCKPKACHGDVLAELADVS